MKKATIYLIIISILFLNFNLLSKAQEEDNGDIIGDIGNIIEDILNLKVPVRDTEVASFLSKILGILGDELKRINSTLTSVLETQYQQEAQSFMVDYLKIVGNMNTLAEAEKFIQLRKERVKNIKTYNEALEEARLVGAYSGLLQFIATTPCINPLTRDRLTAQLMDIARGYNFVLKVEELLNEIPDCPLVVTETEMTASVKPNFFAWLTQPFKLNVAQITQTDNSSREITSVITPAYNQTIASIELTYLVDVGENTITSEAQRKVDERENEIGEIWPVERCTQFIVDKNISGGKALCAKYETLISGEDLKEFKNELTVNNLTSNLIQDPEVYQIFEKHGVILNQTGFTTSSARVTLSNFIEIFTSTEGIKDMIDKFCAPYKAQEKRVAVAYTLCLVHFTKQFKDFSKAIEEKVEKTEEKAKEIKEYIERIKNKAEELKDEIDPQVCPEAYKELEKIANDFEYKTISYEDAINVLSNIKEEIINSNLKIARIYNAILTVVDNILGLLELFDNEKFTTLFNEILDSLNQYLGINLKNVFDKVINTLKNIRKSVRKEVKNVIRDFLRAVTNLVEVIGKYKTLIEMLNGTSLTDAGILNDLYEANLVEQRLEAYQRAIENGMCSSSSREEQEGSVHLIKNQTIVIESKKRQNRSYNFLALFKNLFQPKVVEIRNEK